jgi:uncharacterized protein YciI
MVLKKKHIEYLQKVQESQRQDRRPPEDPDEKEERDSLRKEVLEFLRAINDEKELRRVLIDRFGQRAGSASFENSIRAWRALKRKF